jgi:hypothetical protein
VSPSAKQRLKDLLDEGYEQIDLIERLLESRPSKRVGDVDLEQIQNARMRLEDKWADLQDAEKLLGEEDVEGLYELALLSGEQALKRIKYDVDKLLADDRDIQS